MAARLQPSPEPDEHIALTGLLGSEAAAELSHDYLQTGRWWDNWHWLVLTAVGVAAFTLEAAGGTGTAWHRFEDGLHLFPSGFPGRPAGPPHGESDLQQAAGLLAPLVGLFLSAKLVAIVFRKQLTRLRARARRGHAVVLGLDEKGFRAANGFLDAGRKVTCVAPEPPADLANHLRARGAIVLDADLTQLTSLRTAAVQRASRVVCSSALDRENAQAAAMVVQITRGAGRRSPLFLFVHVGDPDLAHVLRAATLRLGSIRINFFDVNARWARALLRVGPLVTPDVASPFVVIVGATDLGRALAVRAARRWHYERRSGRTGRLTITLVDPEAERVCATLRERFPALGRHTDLVPLGRAIDTANPGGLGELLAGRGADAAVYLCLPDEADNLGVALQVRHQIGAGASRVVVPATAWTFRIRAHLLGGATGITPVFYSPHPNALDLLQDAATEAIARASHQLYLEQRRTAADFGSRPADVDWAELAEEWRESTRRRVDAMVEQLESLWYEVEPLVDWDEEPVALPDDHVEALARMEHDRWCRDRTADGWTYGPVRDDAAGHQPLLVGWEALDEPSREIDRAFVRDAPALLARAGYRLARSAARESLARVAHEHHLERRAAAGESQLEAPSLVPWSELGPDERELNLSAVDDIAVKLVAAGYRMSPNGDGSALTLSPRQVEALAREEHERWCRVRLAQGWRHGERRDDAAKLHPDLVPWEELPESRRRVDREQVEAIPALLARAGRTVVPLLDGS